MAVLKYNRDEARTTPMAKAIAGARARYGDNAFQPMADKMLAGIKKRRAMNRSAKAAGY